MISRVKPLVVFESAFPGSLDPRDRTSYQGGLYFNEGFGNTSGNSLYRTSQYQNKYLGYYKIIPLNIVSISTSASKEGNSFTVELLPDYVYVLYDNLEYLPKEIRDAIGEKNLDSSLTLMSYLDSFLLGTYTSSTTLQSALLPRINLASVLSPMDTVSIYIARIPEYISDSLESVFFGQNPGRIKEIDFVKITKGKAVKQLYDAGINISDLFKLLGKSVTLHEQLYVFRKYSPKFLITQVGLGKEGIMGTFIVRVYGNNDYRKNLWEQEKNLFKNFPDSITEVQQLIGTILARKYVFAVRKNSRVINDIISNIDDYYKSNPISQFISWSAYETMLSIFAETFGENYVNYKSPSFKEIVLPVIKAFVIENLFKDAYPTVLYSYDDSEIKNASKKLSDYLSNVGVREVFGKNSPDNIYTVYVEGVRTLFKLVMDNVKAIKDSGAFNNNIKAQEFIDEKVEGISFKANQSGDGLSLVLRGHITSISENFSVASGGASKSFRISGKGLEHPLDTHEIFFDKVSIKLVSQPVENFSVSISDPISAAKRILENFAPQRIVGKDLDADTLNVKIVQDRGFDAFVKVKNRFEDSPTKYPYIIHGNTLAPSYLSDYSDLKIFTPIHYVSTNLMSALESTYRGLTNSQSAFLGINRNLPDRSSVLKAIKDAVSYNSLYRVFVNQFGELNLTFDISSISIPFSLSIIPPVTDESFISGELSVDEQNVSTMVEVTPTSFSVTAPSSPSLPIFYGRSTAEALYDLVEVYEIKTFDNSKDEGFLKFLDAATSRIGTNVLLAIKKKISSLEKKSKRTTEEENLLQSLKSIDSIVNKTPRDRINSFLKGETITTQKEVKVSVPVVKETPGNTVTVETCGGERETITQTGTQVEIKEEVQKIQQTESVYLFESNPELGKVYSIAREAFLRYLSPIPDTSFYSPASLRNEILDASLSDLCAGINEEASKYLYVNEVCFKENIDALITFMAVGIKFPGREYKNNTNDELNKFVKNYVRRLEIKTLSTPIQGYKSLYEPLSSNVVIEKSFSYFKDFFNYIIPSPDIKDIDKSKLYLANISPDLFLYGLRTRTFQDSFIGTIDATENEEKISTLRAEMYRILNKEPMKTLKATIVGNPNYYPSYTTLVVLEEFSPLKGYITQKTLSQLSDDSQRGYRTIIAVNEIVDSPKFQNLYPSLLPKIPGYNPPTSINSGIVEKYLIKSVEYILSKSKIKHFPAELYIPLFGVYENPQPKTLVGDFIESIFEYLETQFPDKAQLKHSAIYESLLNLAISYGGFLSEGFEYLKPQNYLVAQGQIESVSHSFSVEGSFDTNLNLTYLLPAIYTYIPYKGKKLILGYVVLESPMYRYNDFGNKHNIINIESPNKKNFYEFTFRAVEEAKNHYKEIFSENLINLKLLELMLE